MEQFRMLTVEEMQMINGGSFFKKLWNGIKSVAKAIWKNLDKVTALVSIILFIF